MDITAKISESLNELMFDHGNMTTKALAAKLGLPAPTITRYKNGVHVPTVKNLVMIADYFQCSTDYMLGREDYKPDLTFRKCPPFSEQIVFITNYFKRTFYAFYHEVKIPESTFFEWKNGSSAPSLESLIRIADHFHCRIDFLLGRE